MSTNITPASHSGSNYLPYATIYSIHTTEKIELVYADKAYAGAPNRNFHSMNEIANGIMRKNNINAVLTDTEIARNKSISKNDTSWNSTSAWPLCWMSGPGPSLPPS
ncbi:transposase [Desulfatitalea sp. M08but]|uniref:Transposase n=2 Tax=Desulfatitalea alkaliphila TaxID=2929485 RepID=A0AA41R5F9_9BACT|nr:transposase [Desulfatitalea alkaliphila]